MGKIRFFQFEPSAILLDSDIKDMTPKQFGCFWMLIVQLYCCGGKMELDLKKMAKLCNCRRGFEKVWEKIGKKFQIKENVIRHRRVTRELRRAKRFLQDKRTAGLKGARARWHKQSASDSADSGTAEAKKSNETNNEEREKKKGNVTKNADSRSSSVSHLSSCLSSVTSRLEPPDGTLGAKVLRFYEQLCTIIVPQSKSDKSSFRNIGNWLKLQVLTGRFSEDIFERVLDYARQSKADTSRNPAAVFTAIIKKELRYKV